ncbi:MAG: nucleotidyltransferase family protein [Bryobacteraceae bacterium]
MTGTLQEHVSRCASWAQRFPPEQWTLYSRVIAAADDCHLKFAVGGGLAAATYCGQWRNTKDLDLYTFESDRQQLIALLSSLGFTDYFDQKSYDRRWIYRAWKDGTIIDVIWSMANRRASVDDHWLKGPEVEIDGHTVHLLAPEEMIWNKLYVLQHDRCDWPDVFTVLYSIGADLDWHHLVNRVGEDAALLAGLLSTFVWLCPTHANSFPSWLWAKLGLPAPRPISALSPGQRADLLDSRAWFGPVADQPPEVHNSDLARGAAQC